MTDTVTLRQICTELKLDPREARERLRNAARDPKKHPELAKTHKTRSPWTWVKGSAGEKEARVAIRSAPPEKGVRTVTKAATVEKEARTSAKA